MSKVLLLLLLISISSTSFAKQESKCGVIKGFSAVDRDYPAAGISGFFVSREESFELDIRVTRKNNEGIMKVIEQTGYQNLFICLNSYKLTLKPFNRGKRVYADVSEYRLWQDGQLVFNSEN